MAHAHGIAYRDLKPVNLLMIFSYGGVVFKVLHFGIAKVMQAGFYAGSSGDNPKAPPGPEHVTRGGGFRDMVPQSTTTRDHRKAALPYIGIGMRCARTAS